eukprot:802360-Prymnesium_polylepis.2
MADAGAARAVCNAQVCAQRDCRLARVVDALHTRRHAAVLRRAAASARALRGHPRLHLVRHPQPDARRAARCRRGGVTAQEDVVEAGRVANWRERA